MRWRTRLLHHVCWLHWWHIAGEDFEKFLIFSIQGTAKYPEKLQKEIIEAGLLRRLSSECCHALSLSFKSADLIEEHLRAKTGQDWDQMGSNHALSCTSAVGWRAAVGVGMCQMCQRSTWYSWHSLVSLHDIGKTFWLWRLWGRRSLCCFWCSVARVLEKAPF